MDSIVVDLIQDIKQNLVVLVSQDGSFGLEHNIQIGVVFLEFWRRVSKRVIGSWLLPLFQANIIQGLETLEKTHRIQVLLINYIKKLEIEELNRSQNIKTYHQNLRHTY